MIFYDYTTPKMIVAEKGKHIRAKNDVYVPEYKDAEGNLIPEHIPYYSTTIFVPDIYTEEKVHEDYVEEEILIEETLDEILSKEPLIEE